MTVKIQYGKCLHSRLDNSDLSHVYGASKRVRQYMSGSEFMTLAALTVAVQVSHRDCGSDRISWSVSTGAMSKMGKKGSTISDFHCSQQ